jgi:hypothetical protein
MHTYKKNYKKYKTTNIRHFKDKALSLELWICHQDHQHPTIQAAMHKTLTMA